MKIYNLFENSPIGIGDICCCLTKSENINKKNMAHLISSIIYLQNGVSEENIQNLINYRNKRGNKDRFHFIFIIHPINKDSEGTFLGFKTNVYVVENVIKIELDIDTFISVIKYFLGLNNNISYDNDIYTIFKDMDKDSLFSSSYFIFKGYIWSTVIFKFKLNNIDISGGSTTSRHVLSTTNLNLLINTLFLYDLVNVEELKNDLHLYYKSPFVSNTIPLKFYQEVLDIFNNFNNYLLVNKNLNINSIQLFVENYLENYNVNDGVKKERLIYLITSNLTILIKGFKDKILNIKNKEIESLEKKLYSLNLEIENKKSRIREIASLFSGNYSSVKDKKRKKQARLEFLKNNNNKGINEKELLESELLNLKTKIEKLTLVIKTKKEKYEELKKNINSYKFLELIELSGEKEIINNNDIRYNKYILNNNKFQKGFQKREYSTLHNNNNNNNNNLIVTTKHTDLPLNIESKPNNIKISKEKSYYYGELYKLLNNTELSDFEKQELLERTWIDIFTEQFRKVENYTNPHNFLIINKLKKSEETLKLFFEHNVLFSKFPLIYDSLNDFKFIYLTFVICIQSISTNTGYTTICRKVGSQILNSLFISNSYKYSKKDNDNFELSFKEYCNKINIISNEDFITLGDFFINILLTFPTDIFEREYNKYDAYYEHIEVKLKLNKKIIDEINNFIIINPSNLPMIHKPLMWSNEKYGGYILNSKYKESLITGNTHHKHKMANFDSLYNTVNYLNSIPFKINTDVLNYILNTDNTNILEDLYKNNTILKNKLTIATANLFKDLKFYIPVNSDWRGRIYNIPYDINYQGSDLSLSLLEFNEGTKLTEEGLDSLYIYGANSYNENNISKDSFENRINWVKNNLNKIYLMNNDFINKAENKFVFIAFCLTMRKIKNNPDYKVHLPVFLDATCNGIQHLAALIKDDELGQIVNLKSQDKDSKPNDIYSKLLLGINKKIQETGKLNPQFANLSNVELKRKNVKKCIMTKTYNVSIIGMKDNLKETFKEFVLPNLENKKIKFKDKLYIVPSVFNSSVLLNNNDIFKMANIIYDIIYTEYPALKELYQFFINMAKLLSELKLPILWVTPSGLNISQEYMRSKKKTVAIYLGGKSKKLVLTEWLEALDKTKQNNAFIPNFIHSLDASHIYKIIEYNNKDKNHPNASYPIITVHDCFGTHPNNLQRLNKIVKLEFINLYSNYNNLDNFKNINLEFIKNSGYTLSKDNKGNDVVLLERKILTLPNIPKMGKLDIKNIINSQHFIT